MFEAKNRRLYTKEFKQDALNLSNQPGYSVPQPPRALALTASKYTAGERNLMRKAP
ncbi:MAG: transposase [Fibromonadaceae bacterium]|jgi:transposase-like protein|nr:transposase [Fibromonadaceae bacterium]